MRLQPKYSGFTLAELLIALFILGVIATFSIPKVIFAQQNQTYNAIAKETMGTIANCYVSYSNTNVLTTTTIPNSIISSCINYVKMETVSPIDDKPSGGVTINCSGGSMCYVLHGGAILRPQNCSFGGNANTNAVMFTLDPDGKNTGRQDSLAILLHYNGKLDTWGTAPAGSVNDCSTFNANPIYDPSWLNW